MSKRGFTPKVKLENPKESLFRLLSFIFEDYKWHCLLVVICIFISSIATIIGTNFIQTLVDVYIIPLIGVSNPDFSLLLQALMMMACIYLVGILANFAYNKILVSVAQGTLKNVRDKLFTHMEKLPIKYFDTHAHGDIMSIYTNDTDTLRQMISQSMPNFISSLFTIVGVFISMVRISIPLTILVVIMVVVIKNVSAKVIANSGKYFVLQQQNLGKVNGYIEEMMAGQKVIKVFTHEQKTLDEFNVLNDNLNDTASATDNSHSNIETSNAADNNKKNVASIEDLKCKFDLDKPSNTSQKNASITIENRSDSIFNGKIKLNFTDSSSKTTDTIEIPVNNLMPKSSYSPKMLVSNSASNADYSFSGTFDSSEKKDIPYTVKKISIGNNSYRFDVSVKDTSYSSLQSISKDFMNEYTSSVCSSFLIYFYPPDKGDKSNLNDAIGDFYYDYSSNTSKLTTY